MVQELLRRSDFKSEVIPDGDDRLLFLCTCSYESEDARYLVAGRLSGPFPPRE